MKKESSVFNIFSLVFLNFSFWISSDYPRHIFERVSFGYDVSKCIFNALSLTIYFFFLAAIVACGNNLFSKRLLKWDNNYSFRHCIINVVLLFVIQVCFELLNSMIAPLFGLWGFLFEDFLLLGLWIAVLFVLTRKRNLKLKFDGKSGAFYGIILIIFLFCIITDISICIELVELFEKYVPFSNALNVLSQNGLFRHSLVLLVLDTILGVAVIEILSRQEEGVPSLMDMITEDEDNNYQNGNRTFIGAVTSCIRVAILALLCMILVILPSAVFARTGFLSRLNYNVMNKSGIGDGGFGDTETTLSVSRYFDSNAERTCFLKKTVLLNNCVLSDGKPLCDRYALNAGLDNYNYDIVDGRIERSGNYKEYIFDGKTAYLFKNSAICYSKGDVPVVVPLEKLCDIEQDEIVTNVLKMMLKEGNIFAFEFGKEYLSKFDYDFFLDYVDRFSERKFTQNETLYINKLMYNADYIVSLARNL